MSPLISQLAYDAVGKPWNQVIFSPENYKYLLAGVPWLSTDQLLIDRFNTLRGGAIKKAILYHTKSDVEPKSVEMVSIIMFLLTK